ncbi:MAG: hypothetical protein FWC41_08735, partial [Firmicutes bacterium]|nr:hypothetical protein [Bacillota bacterium]
MKKIILFCLVGILMTACYPSRPYTGPTHKNNTYYNFDYKKIVDKYELTNGNGCLYHAISITKNSSSMFHNVVSEFVCDCNVAQINDIVELMLIQSDSLNIWYPLNSKINYT